MRRFAQLTHGWTQLAQGCTQLAQGCTQLAQGWTARLFISLAVVVSACSSAAPKSELPTQLLPASLPTADDGEAEQVVRVRVYAGADFRARVVGWQKELDLVVASSSALLQRASGARLEVVETIDWKRSGGKLSKTLQSLSSLDRGVDVDLVIGLIDAPAEVENEYAQLIAAEVLGRHLVVRSFNRQAESAALDPSAATLDEATKDELLDRRRHKQSLLLAQGIAKLYGAADAGVYSTTETALDARAAAILRVTMAAHLKKVESKAEGSAVWVKALEELETMDVRPELLEIVRSHGEAADVPRKTEDETLDALRSIDREKLENVSRLLKEGEASTAWEVLEPLTELYPEAPPVVDLACLAAHARGASDALARCQKAITISDSNAQTWLRLGLLQVEKEPLTALQSLHRAQALLTDASAGWEALARAYQKLSLPSLALKAAAKTKGGKSVATWARESRSRYGSHVGVAEESEGQYLVALKGALKLVYKNDYKAARSAVAELHQSFPKSIGVDLIQCEIALRRRKYAAAKSSCQGVLARQADNAWARYLLGIVHLREKKQDAGIALLVEAITKDPGLKAAYEALAKVYRPRSDARLKSLKAQYKEQFGRELR
jgi:hypothetical protein